MPLEQMRVSIIIPTRDENASLVRTVELLIPSDGAPILEIIIVIAPHASSECRDAVRQLVARYPQVVREILQAERGLGDACHLGIAHCRGTHAVIMFADLESDPDLLPILVDVASEFPMSIVSASRWLRRGSFHGYSRPKLVLNWLAQQMTRRLYWSSATDFTFGYRMYPLALLRQIQLKEAGHGFVYEVILKAIRLGIDIREIPATWTCRQEGMAAGGLRAYVSYPRIALATWLSRVHRFRRNPAVSSGVVDIHVSQTNTHRDSSPTLD